MTSWLFQRTKTLESRQGYLLVMHGSKLETIGSVLDHFGSDSFQIGRRKAKKTELFRGDKTKSSMLQLNSNITSPLRKMSNYTIIFNKSNLDHS
jgi:hypothetical protein